MDYSDIKNKTIMKKLVCEKYITADSKGKIKFKSNLNDAIEHGDISDDDALSISLELMYGIKNYGYNEISILDELDNLVLKVKEYNLGENPNLKNNVIFFKNYDFEREVLSEFIDGLDSNYIIPVEENKPQKIKSNDIKKYLEHFSREDLCYILDINPDLNFDKEKKLKKQIGDEFNKYDYDFSKLQDASKDDIKKYLDSLVKESVTNQPIESIPETKKQTSIRMDENTDIQKDNHLSLNKKNKSRFEKLKYNIESEDIQFKNEKSISKKEFDKLIQKVRLFNYKKLQSMISLKSQYSQIYQIISSKELDRKNNDLKRFKYYYENFDKIEDLIKIIDKIKQKEDLIDKFQAELSNNSSSDSKSNCIILEFKELYETVYTIEEYPYCLKDKIFDEFIHLEYFIQNYENLLDNYGFKSDNYIEKITLVELIEKSKLFYNKKLEDMVSLKKEYHAIYQKISQIDVLGLSDKYYSEFDVFMDYYEYCEELLDLYNKIRLNEELIDKFCIEIYNGDYLSNSRRNDLIIDFKDFYNLASQLYHYPKGMELQIFDELKNLKCFLAYYSGLIDYGGNNGLFIKELNEKYIKNEINNNRIFFKDIKDKNKKRAIVCDEDNIKVVAGAGAGKTFIIEKKINYLIENGKDSEKILCLCYTKKGVNQLNKKVNNPSNGHKVKVFTFHEFCRRVSKECGENKTSDRYLLDRVIRKYVGDIVNDSKKLDKLSQYFSYYSIPQLENEKFNTINEYEEYRESNKFVSLKKKYNYCDKNLDVSNKKRHSLCGKDNETVKGECVKSIGELLIANYLFMHKIEYKYENQYPYNDMAKVIEKRFVHSANYFSLGKINKKISNEKIVRDFIDWEQNKQYFPDFYLPKYDIYIEHFGVNENMEATFLEGDEKEKYERDMKYKSIEHSIYGTKLIKTYWYYLLEDRLLKELEEELDKYNVQLEQMSREEIVDMLMNNERVKDFDNFSKLVKNFINIYESKNLQKADFDKFRSKNTNKDIYTKNRQNLFFDIVEDIYNEYYDENLKGTLSHNHEIFNALKLIQTKKFNRKYNYIFVDEYQDINPVRCKLLQELQKNSNAKLFVVGDDWQSIYGFTGSNVGLFIDFDKYFINPEVIYIEENRRNPQKLIDISSEFITKYNGQDERKLTNYNKNNLNPIKIVKYQKDNWSSKTLKLDAILDDILKHSRNPKILILGRNNDDINDYIGNVLFKEDGDGKIRKIIYSERPDLDITFMTIHQAKGLEADEVIVLNLEDRNGGFPNKMDDDPILSFVKDDDEREFAEERRLLYVALTRSRNNVYLFTPSKSTSQFIHDLMVFDGVSECNIHHRIYKNDLPDSSDFLEDIVVNETHLDCPNSFCDGKISIIENNVNKTTYVRCNKFPRSREHYDGGPYPKWGLNDIKYVKKCPKCRGILVRNGDILKCCLNYYEGCMEKEELKLDKDELEFDYE